MTVELSPEALEKLYNQYLTLKTSSQNPPIQIQAPIKKKEVPVLDYVCTRGLAKECSTKKQKNRQMCTKCFNVCVAAYKKKKSPPKRTVPPIQLRMKKIKDVVVDI
jgi:hypothetical protein